MMGKHGLAPYNVFDARFVDANGRIYKRQPVGEKWENVCSEGLEEGEQLALVFYFDGK